MKSIRVTFSVRKTPEAFRVRRNLHSFGYRTLHFISPLHKLGEIHFHRTAFIAEYRKVAKFVTATFGKPNEITLSACCCYSIKRTRKRGGRANPPRRNLIACDLTTRDSFFFRRSLNQVPGAMWALQVKYEARRRLSYLSRQAGGRFDKRDLS